MPTEVQSPISRKGSKAGSSPPLSPGAKSAPRGDNAQSTKPEPVKQEPEE